MMPQRVGASSAFFKDVLWIIGGTTERTSVLHNDIWYSNNGLNWSEIQSAAEFSSRSWHSTAVFRDRIWVIGGYRGNNLDSLANDVWYSDNGISWKQATPGAEFSPRSDLSSFVYQDKLWVIGGRDRTGYLNDVWYSGDGIHWTRATASAPFIQGINNAVVFDNRIWVIQNSNNAMEISRGIWYSYDGITWTEIMSSPEFFKREYTSGQPHLTVFNNRLWVFQRHNSDTGIWYTMLPGGNS
jgi:hypothetical protein